MKKYKKYVIFGTVVNLMFYLLSLAPRVSAAQCQDFTCSLGYHTYHDHYLKSSDGSRQGEKKVYISPDFRDHSISIIRSAWKEWNYLGERMKLVEVKKKENCRIYFVPKTLEKNTYGQAMIRLKKDGPLYSYVDDITQNYIYARIQLDEYKCNLKSNLFKIAVHETGHALGLTHVSCRSSAMYTYWNDSLATNKPTASDISTLAHIYK